MLNVLFCFRWKSYELKILLFHLKFYLFFQSLTRKWLDPRKTEYLSFVPIIQDVRWIRIMSTGNGMGISPGLRFDIVTCTDGPGIIHIQRFLCNKIDYVDQVYLKLVGRYRRWDIPYFLAYFVFLSFRKM